MKKENKSESGKRKEKKENFAFHSFTQHPN
jgi:hypothetical protein